MRLYNCCTICVLRTKSNTFCFILSPNSTPKLIFISVLLLVFYFSLVHIFIYAKAVILDKLKVSSKTEAVNRLFSFLHKMTMLTFLHVKCISVKSRKQDITFTMETGRCIEEFPFSNVRAFQATSNKRFRKIQFSMNNKFVNEDKYIFVNSNLVKYEYRIYLFYEKYIFAFE